VTIFPVLSKGLVLKANENNWWDRSILPHHCSGSPCDWVTYIYSYMLKLTPPSFCLLTYLCIVNLCCLSASGQTSDLRYLIDEGTPPVSAVIGYATTGSDSAIIVDNTQRIFLFISDYRNKMIGKIGSGSCEHQKVSSFVVDEDTLFILDNQLARITGYSISSGKCVREIGLSSFSEFGQIGRYRDKFFLAKKGYNSTTAPNETLFYSLDSSEELTPMGLTLVNIEADLLLMPVRMSRRIPRIKANENKLRFLLPFSHKVWEYDALTEEFSSFNLVNRSADISNYALSQDMSLISKIMHELEFEMDIFPLDNKVVVMSLFESQLMLRRYTYSGELIGEKSDIPHVDFEEDGILFSLNPSEDFGAKMYSIEPVILPSGDNSTH